jgi:AraC-like DNA-binding protein
MPYFSLHWWSARAGRCWSFYGLLTGLLCLAVSLAGYGQLSLADGLAVQGQNLREAGRWWIDPSGELPLAAVWPQREADFVAWGSLEGEVPRGGALWACLTLRNEGADADCRLWFPNKIFDEFQAFRLESGRWDTVAAGRLTPHHRLPFQDNFMALPLCFEPGAESLVLLRFRMAGRIWLEVEELYLLTAEEERAKRGLFHDNRQSRDLYYFFFLAFIGIFVLVSLGQWAIYRSRAILYYCLYLVVIGLYYLRNLEVYQFNIRPFIKHFSNWHYHLEILLAFLSYALYMTFANILLEMRQYYPALSNLLRWGACFFIGAIPVLWLIEWQWDVLAMEAAYVNIRIVFFLVAFGLVFTLGRRNGHRLAGFIVVGTSFLVLGGMMSLLESIIGGESQKVLLGGAFGWYLSPGGRAFIPIYDFKVGVMVEVLAFSAALFYRQWLLSRSYRATLARLEQALPPAPKPGGETDPPRYPFPLHSDFVRQAVACAEAHLENEDFKVRELAQALGMRRETLYQRLMQETGLPPSAFLRTLRLWQARRLLWAGAHNASEAAYAAGFKYPSNFTKAFKEEFGYPPSEAVVEPLSKK